ncbi:hypothetical protein ABIF73_000536 [Bradyrhizobium japonicum]|nr:hypothetical protein [Bradyrhizobium japonicum]MCS3912610.1 hypothetical protein [Bradyrhizobium japonicum]
MSHTLMIGVTKSATAPICRKALERFQAKWIPVRIKKTRQNKKLMPRSDSVGTER